MPSGTAKLEEVRNILPYITYRRMMGEYLLYRNGKLFGGIYDDRLLLKITKASAGIDEWSSAFPYEDGPEMVLVTEPYDVSLLSRVVEEMLSELPEPKKR